MCITKRWWRTRAVHILQSDFGLQEKCVTSRKIFCIRNISKVIVADWNHNILSSLNYPSRLLAIVWSRRSWFTTGYYWTFLPQRSRLSARLFVFHPQPPFVALIHTIIVTLRLITFSILACWVMPSTTIFGSFYPSFNNRFYPTIHKYELLNCCYNRLISLLYTFSTEYVGS